MTIRRLIEAKKRRIMVLVLLGAALAAAGVLLSQQGVLNAEPRFAVLPGGAVFMLTLVYANLFAFRCPRCGGRWEALAMQEGLSLFALDRRITFCPFCGADVDAEPGRGEG
jgi:hypothetical protein